MVFKTFQNIIRTFSLALLFHSNQLLACGWGDTSETTRLALFRAERNHFIKLRPFCYSANSFMYVNATSNNDQRLNCMEWQRKLGSCAIDDIFKILYATESEKFENAYQAHNLTTVFEGNSFIKALLLKKNKAFLDYILLAKNIEYNNFEEGKWESWDKIQLDWNESAKVKTAITNFRNRLNKTNDTFLKKRYAFLLLRYDFYNSGSSEEIVNLYKTYFSKENQSILDPWAMHYMALTLEDKVLANYYLSKVFVLSDEKAYPSYQSFNKLLYEQTLKLAKNDFERGIIKLMKAMRNPAPALNQLKEIHQLMPQSEYFSFLVGREINKLEDWIFTPEYANSEPSVTFSNLLWYPDYEKAKRINYSKDMAYLRELKAYLILIQANSTGEQKDYLSIAIAHVCFINDEIDLGRKYVAMIDSSANTSIQLQKNIELVLVAIKQENIQQETTKQQLVTCFNSIENCVETDNTMFKTMYTLYRIVGKEYQNQHDAATAGLFYLKSNNKKYSGRDEYSYYSYDNSEEPSYYFFIGYFERYATTKDMDNLIALIQKEKKTPFEKYICSGTVQPDVNIYKDVKGTIAFRDGNLELAQRTFAEMPTDFWGNNYEFGSYLNENPFFPKPLTYIIKDYKYDYKFNKANFVASLIRLKKLHTADSYLKLASAYYNVSYFGSSWMMISYSTSYRDTDYSDYIFGSNEDNKAKFQSGNFYNLNLAKFYYNKALKIAKNDEQKALASLMLFECDYRIYSRNLNWSDYNSDKVLPEFTENQSIMNFYKFYKNTTTFRRYNCPLLEEFI